jgi:hypothetical protein
MVNGPLRDHKPRGNFGIPQPSGDKNQDLLLACGEISEVLSRGSAGAPR